MIDPYYVKKAETVQAIPIPDNATNGEVLKTMFPNCEGYGEFEAFASMVENWRTEIFNYFDYRFTNAITESINRVSKEISSQGRGYNFKVLRAKILYRNPASKPAKYKYDVQTETDDFDNIIISSGVLIDDLLMPDHPAHQVLVDMVKRAKEWRRERDIRNYGSVQGDYYDEENTDSIC